MCFNEFRMTSLFWNVFLCSHPSFCWYILDVIYLWMGKYLFSLLRHLKLPKHCEVAGEGTDFMVSHVMVTTIQRLTHVKRGPCHSLSPVRHHGSVLQIHGGGRGRDSGLFCSSPPLLLFPLWYSPVELAATKSLIENSKWGSPWHFQSIRVCRMAVACKVSLKQSLNFWTCHLAFLLCNCMWTLPAFVLQAEDGLCVNFSHLSHSLSNKHTHIHFTTFPYPTHDISSLHMEFMWFLH